MNFWNQHDLEVMNTQEKIILLKEKFDKKNNKEDENYCQKLNQFLNRNLKRESDLIIKTGVFIPFSE